MRNLEDFEKQRNVENLLKGFINGWITQKELEESLKKLKIFEIKEFLNNKYATPQRNFKKGHL